MKIEKIYGIPVLHVYNGDTGLAYPIVDHRLRGMIRNAHESGSWPNILPGWAYGIGLAVGGLLAGSGAVTHNVPLIWAGGVIMVGSAALGINDAVDTAKIPQAINLGIYDDLRKGGDENDIWGRLEGGGYRR